MTYKKFNARLLLTTINLIAASAFGQTPGRSSVASKPNVIVIYSDDQGAMDLNCYGSKDLTTPNLDRLASNGVRFTQFYSASPICSPSRASLLTARYPQRAGLPDMASSQENVAGMPGSQYTMAELFKDGGYTTAHIGKWHVGYTPETMPNQQGFDQSFGFMGGCIDNYSHYFYWQGPNRHDLWRNGKEVWEPGKFFPDLMVDEAGQFMEKNKAKPFFLYFAINIPHYPLQAPPKWLEHYKNLPPLRQRYAAFVSTMDEEIGKLYKKLDQLGLAKNTIIIFQSDQGFSEEDRGYGGGGSAKPFRGSKYSVLEGGVRVPAIISWPGHIPKNEVRTQVAANIDWFPTLADYCNLELPQRKLDGKSLKTVIASATAPTPHPVFYWQSGGGATNPQWAVRDGDWKLLHNPVQVKASELNEDKLMLVNMKRDSTEHTNEAADHPEIVTRLKQQYLDWIKQVNEQ